MYLLRKTDIKAGYVIINYPKIRQSERVELPDDEMVEVDKWIDAITEIIKHENYGVHLNVRLTSIGPQRFLYVLLILPIKVAGDG